MTALWQQLAVLQRQLSRERLLRSSQLVQRTTGMTRTLLEARLQAASDAVHAAPYNHDAASMQLEELESSVTRHWDSIYPGQS